MDPDKALENMRAAVRCLEALVKGSPLSTPPITLASIAQAIIISEAARDMVDHWEALDGWMSKGGYRPEDWKP